MRNLGLSGRKMCRKPLSRLGTAETAKKTCQVRTAGGKWSSTLRSNRTGFSPTLQSGYLEKDGHGHQRVGQQR